jgi:hypothetical protein
MECMDHVRLLDEEWAQCLREFSGEGGTIVDADTLYKKYASTNLDPLRYIHVNFSASALPEIDFYSMALELV